MSKLSKKEARIRRHRRVRHKVSGTAAVPRMSVCRTGKNLYVQLIDDDSRRTLAAASTLESAFSELNVKVNQAGAGALGKLVAARAVEANITKVVFDRGGFRYHGQIKALADGAREGGLKF